MDATIRTATPADAPDVRRIARESWHAAHDEILGVETVESVVDDWYEREQVRGSIERTDGRFLVAEDDPGETVGFAQAVLGDEGEPAWLVRIYLHPDYWGEGVGSELLARVESWLRAEDAERLRLAVMADNAVGNAFYETHGYEVVEERAEDVHGVEFEEYVRETDL